MFHGKIASLYSLKSVYLPFHTFQFSPITIVCGSEFSGSFKLNGKPSLFVVNETDVLGALVVAGGIVGTLVLAVDGVAVMAFAAVVNAGGAVVGGAVVVDGTVVVGGAVVVVDGVVIVDVAVVVDGAATNNFPPLFVVVIVVVG